MWAVLLDMFASLIGFTPFLEHDKTHLLTRKLFSVIFLVFFLFFLSLAFFVAKNSRLKSRVQKLDSEIEILKSDNLTMLTMLKEQKATSDSQILQEIAPAPMEETKIEDRSKKVKAETTKSSYINKEKTIVVQANKVSKSKKNTVSKQQNSKKAVKKIQNKKTSPKSTKKSKKK
ncbi:MAG: hypothetical protein LBU55_00065 [Elusimicrobiota bacterium]|nr:hypothetical protein [Elusimicrobiota bacterium]